MKTIVDNATNTSRYLLADDKPVNVTSQNIEVGDPANLDYIVGDLNSGNATVIENVTEPDDWFGCKYFLCCGRNVDRRYKLGRSASVGRS